MDINLLLESIKKHPDFDKVGMVLCHNGVVRCTSRDGREVKGLRVAVDHEKLAHIIAEQKKTAGIVEITVEIAEDRDLKVGDDVMLLLVAGYIRISNLLFISSSSAIKKSKEEHHVFIYSHR